jgi:hypothetical protein
MAPVWISACPSATLSGDGKYQRALDKNYNSDFDKALKMMELSFHFGARL